MKVPPWRQAAVVMGSGARAMLMGLVFAGEGAAFISQVGLANKGS